METCDFEKTHEDISYQEKATAYSELNALIDATSDNELACRKKLIEFFYTLLDPDTRAKYKKAEIQWERTEHSGRSDLIIVASWENDRGEPERKCFLWELKSPKTRLFSYKNQGMLIPAIELVEAETQLINYFDELKESRELPNLSLGGIVIGNDKNFANRIPAIADSEHNRLVDKARRIRNEYFYRRCDIQLLTWTDILNRVNSVMDKTFKPPNILDLSVSVAGTEIKEDIGESLN